MSGAWKGLGAWADDAERAEAEERDRQLGVAEAGRGTGVANESQNFPSLKEAAAAKPKKKKATAMSLYEFNMGARRETEPKGLTQDEKLQLPTRPKERSAEELEYSRMGGFRGFDRSGAPPGRMTRDRGDDRDSSWGSGGRRSYGGDFNDERRGPPPPRPSDYDQPSRADEVDDWVLSKKSIPAPPLGSGRQDRYASLGGSVGRGSRADEVDKWDTGKKPLQARSGGAGSGFRDSAVDSDRWSRGGSRDGDRERPRLALDRPRGDIISNEPPRNRPSPFGAARPREEILAEKGLDWRKLDLETEQKKTSRPTSSHSSRPSSAHSSHLGSPPPLGRVEGPAKPRQKPNPFGDAKPRELVLQEKGKDWRKMDLELEHRAVDRLETEEEKIIKEEIKHMMELMKEVKTKVNGLSTPVIAEEPIGLQEQIHAKERELEQLMRDLDDKVRFGQKTSERPGSGAGRIASFSDRPPSQSGISTEPRSMDIMERPRSGGSDVWISGDDRKTFQSRERGFFASRNLDRSKSRERW